MQQSQSNKKTSLFGAALGHLTGATPKLDIEKVKLISMNQFNVLCHSSQIRRFVIQEGSGGYMLLAQSKRQVDFHALGVNNMIRTWSDLSSVIKFLQSNIATYPEITIRLKRESTAQ